MTGSSIRHGNLVERLRRVAKSHARSIDNGPGSDPSHYLEGQAADEIKRLQNELREMRAGRCNGGGAHDTAQPRGLIDCKPGPKGARVISAGR